MLKTKEMWTFKVCLFKISCPKLIQLSQAVKYFYILLYDTNMERKINPPNKGGLSNCGTKSKRGITNSKLEKKKDVG